MVVVVVAGAAPNWLELVDIEGANTAEENDVVGAVDVVTPKDGADEANEKEGAVLVVEVVADEKLGTAVEAEAVGNMLDMFVAGVMGVTGGPPGRELAAVVVLASVVVVGTETPVTGTPRIEEVPREPT